MPGSNGHTANDRQVSVAFALEHFFATLRLAPRSQKAYKIGLRRFAEFVSREAECDVAALPVTTLTIDHVTDFLTTIMPEDIRAPEDVSRMRSAQNRLAAVRKFYAFLAAYDLHPTLENDKLRVRIAAIVPRFSPPPPDVRLTDLECILAYVKKQPREEKPHRELRRLKTVALVLTLFRTGVRVSELCALRRRDIDLVERTAHIYRAKGGKSRTVHFDDETGAALTAYWKARLDGGRGVGTLPAFSGRDKPGQPGNAINPRTVELIVAELGRGSGIESEVTPHSFRHGLATELVRRRVRESTVQTILGHASPATTRIYVHKTALEVQEEYHEAFARTAPRVKLHATSDVDWSESAVEGPEGDA
ncbi:MAG: tyrosine-type recombinase/integrase [Thermomicrobiales bacterium]